jgi:hypothetical protein
VSEGGRNPVRAVAPGERGEVPLGDDLRAHVIHGARPGPTVWAWAPRGASDPSMAQALGELRDRLSPSSLAGAVGLLLDGPPPPLGREPYRWAHAVRALCDGAAAVVLCTGMDPGCVAAPHVGVELGDKASRRVARALGASFVTPPSVWPRLNRALLTAPTALWIDGERERLCRPVIERAEQALRSLLATLGMIREPPHAPTVRVVVKTLLVVDTPAAGVAEPAVAPGQVVHAGEVAAFVGEPGLRSRQPLRAPATGVVLYAHAGRVAAGPVLGIGRLRRTLPSVVRAHAAPSPRRLDVGWCERVALPELGIARLKAKIDTGARTSALHIVSMRDAGPDAAGLPMVDIEIPGKRGQTLTARVAIVDHTLVRDSGGHADRRPVIETLLVLGGSARRVRVSLTDRGDMLFPMLIGRTALGGEVRIHPGGRWLLG